ncbi:DDE-type integrase/transposase/recombinase [Mycolicibacterium austroafricanum]|uniref:DDE-type integrase/transposase/recombinase n=1 Tax=Mycolicibacterium austroafricanum TaxID=39687 RepID=UPI000566F519|nr:DDE-type integrase/transposase/recombinase [Mycolicibacterium austroafricanum]QZY47082.1 DDE-type integrase/transposase/recombinase [Mycolicibacterium austroafricanum]
MTRASTSISTGTRFLYEGMAHEIVEMHVAGDSLEVLAKALRGETIRRLSLRELLMSDRSVVLPAADEVALGAGEAASITLAAVPAAARQRACDRAAHVREVLTGYRSGCAETALPWEPKPEYRSEVPVTERYRAKAFELRAAGERVAYRTIERWVQLYRAHGEAGLVSQREVQPGIGGRQDPRWRETALEVMGEYLDLSKPNEDLVIRRTRARLEARFGVGAVKMPSQRTAYRILGELEDQQPLFNYSTKRNRDVAARSKEVYGKLAPMRPGEYLLMDTTRLDVFAMDPHTLTWINAELTVAMDWYSRCITGLRLTPVSTKSIDAAAALYETFRPRPAGRDWPAEAMWPPRGIPRSVLVEQQVLDANSVLAATPAVVPDTLIVDHGKIYVSAHLNSVCQRLGISIQPARLRQPRDKGPVERFFNTLRVGLLQELPGYKGQDVFARGLSPEQDSWFYLDELEAIIREWIAVIYHHTSHDSLTGFGIPGLHMTPAEMFAHGVARAGYLEVPSDPDLAYEFLPVAWRTIQHYGIEIDGRIYKGDIVAGRAKEKSPYPNGKWPIAYNVDDITKVFFRDQRTQRWHQLTWEHADMLDAPMSEEILRFERQLAKAQNRYVDDPLAITSFLERRKLTVGNSMAERRMVIRVAREQSGLITDLAAPSSSELSSVTTALDRQPGQRGLAAESADGLADDLDDEPDQPDVLDDADEPPLEHGSFYDAVLEVQ